jgi:PST family polysaccharide transporter
MTNKKNVFFQKISNHRSLIQNYSYLALIQIVNLVVTLATYPYLIRTLGKELFGLVVFAQAIVGYFVILVSFGFNISATKEISYHRDDKKKVEEILSSILLLKGALFVISLLLLLISSFFIKEANGHLLLFFLSMFACFYEFIYPSWYFQGTEKMKEITIITLTSKLIFLALIFIFVKSKENYLLVPLFYGVGSVVAGLYSIYIVTVKEKLKLSFQPLNTLIYFFKEAITFFISNVSIQIYANANKVIIGSTLGMVEVAYYDLAEKVVLLLKLPQAILMQTIFPRISKDLNKSFIRKMFIYSSSGNALLYILILIFAPLAVQFLGSKDMFESTNILRLLAITIPINGMSNFFSVQVLTPFGHKKEIGKIVVTSLILYSLIISMLYLNNLISLTSMVLATLVTELNTLIMAYIIVKRKNLIELY